MEPYVIHWLDGIERDYRHHGEPPKQDFICFVKKPNKNPLDTVRIDVERAGPLAFEAPLLVKRPWTPRLAAKKENVSKAEGSTSKTEEKSDFDSNSDSNSSAALAAHAPTADQDHHPVEPVVQCPSIHEEQFYHPIQRIFPFRRPKVVAEIRIPRRKCQGLQEIFNEKDFAHYLHPKRVKNSPIR